MENATRSWASCAKKRGDLFLRSRASLVYLFCAILNFKRLRDDRLSRER